MNSMLNWAGSHSGDLTNILIYGAIAVVTLIGLFKCLLPLWGTTHALRHAIARLQDEAGERRDVPVWQETRFMGRRLKGCWLRFLQNAEQLDRRGLPCNVEDYINDDTVTHGPGNATLAELIPNLLTSLGILGTFLGMTSGLSGLNSSSADAMMAGINTLLSGMQFAFGTSVAGVSCSLVFNMLNRIAQGSSYRATDDFVESFTQLAMQRPLDNDVQLICQNQDRNHLLSGVSDAMTGQMPTAIEEAVTRSLSPLSTSMDRFLNGATRSQIEGVNQVVNAFVLNMNNALDHQFLQLGETLTVVNQQQMASNQQLASALQSTQQMLDRAQQMNGISENVLKRFESYMTEATELRRRDEHFESDAAQVLAQLKSACDSQAALLQSIRQSQEQVTRSSAEYQQAVSQSMQGFRTFGGEGAAHTSASQLTSVAQQVRSASAELSRSYEDYVRKASSDLTSSLREFETSVRGTISSLSAQLDRLERMGGAASNAADMGAIQRLLTDIRASLPAVDPEQTVEMKSTDTMQMPVRPVSARSVPSRTPVNIRKE